MGSRARAKRYYYYYYWIDRLGYVQRGRTRGGRVTVTSMAVQRWIVQSVYRDVQNVVGRRGRAKRTRLRTRHGRVQARARDRVRQQIPVELSDRLQRIPSVYHHVIAFGTIRTNNCRC